jgi:hypothetical protein
MGERAADVQAKDSPATNAPDVAEHKRKLENFD